MTIVKKPDFTLFASEAKTGEVDTFPNLLRGWGVTMEQTAGKPPMEWFNALQQRTDHWLMYLSQRGIPEWDSRMTYPLFAVVQHGGKFYVAKKESAAQPPDTSQNVWMSMAAALDLPAGSLTEKGLVQLSNATDSETMAATPKAVKAAMDLAASSSVKSVNGKKGEVQLTAGDVGALAQTGGTVNGPLTVEGKTQFTGELYANRGAQFGGNLVVSWGGRTATFHENGDVSGPLWGGALSAWIKNRTQTSGGRGGWWYKDESSGFIFQGGVVNRSGNTNRVNFSIAYNRECFGVLMTLSERNGASSHNIFAKNINNSGFDAMMDDAEKQAYWWAVGV